MSWVIYALLAAVTAALVGITGKIGIRGIDATVATTIRGITIALTMGLSALLLGRWGAFGSIDSKSLFYIILTGVLGGLSWLFGFLALQSGGEATAVNAIDRLSIVILLVFAGIFLGEAVTGGKILGALLIVLGVILVTVPTSQLAELFSRLIP